MKPLLFLFVLFAGYFAGACPLGEKEDHLTIQRVMRNFGRFIMPAEMIAYRGQNKFEVITDPQLQEAIEKLSLVIACANAVIANPEGDLIAVVARSLDEAKRKNYIDTFVYVMEDFQLSLTDYQNEYIKLLATPAEARDFTGLLKKTKEQNALIDRAHAKL